MTKEWIEHLAQEISQKNHEAAEEFGREQHRQAIILAQGQPFFTAFSIQLEENVNEIRRQLQGDVAAAETTFQSVSPSELKLTRSRFPWFDARVLLRNGVIVLDFAKDRGIGGDPAIDRISRHFDFHVAEDDSFSAREAFGDTPAHFREPGELARHITEILFAV